MKKRGFSWSKSFGNKNTKKNVYSPNKHEVDVFNNEAKGKSNSYIERQILADNFQLAKTQLSRFAYDASDQQSIKPIELFSISTSFANI